MGWKTGKTEKGGCVLQTALNGRPRAGANRGEDGVGNSGDGQKSAQRRKGSGPAARRVVSSLSKAFLLIGSSVSIRLFQLSPQCSL